MIDMFDMIETSSFLYWEIQLSLLLLISLSSAIAYESGVPVQSPVISHLLLKLSVRRNVAQKFLASSLSIIGCNGYIPRHRI